MDADSLRMLKLIDIGCNLTDSTFHGYYNGQQVHEDDVQDILQRAWSNSVDKIIITGDSLFGSREAARICGLAPTRLYMTVGCHPTRSKQWQANADKYYADLLSEYQANRDKVVAIGECGLDYDRLRFCSVFEQKFAFYRQLRIAAQTKLPLFLHSRAAHRDFMDIYTDFERGRTSNSSSDNRLRGVVHSFTGSAEELEEILTKTNFYIGINGLSMKTPENVRVARLVPLNRLMLETDAPYCELRPKFAAYEHVKTKFEWCNKENYESGCMVRGRNEPSTMIQVLEALAGIRDESAEAIASAAYENTLDLFFRSNSDIKWNL